MFLSYTVVAFGHLAFTKPSTVFPRMIAAVFGGICAIRGAMTMCSTREARTMARKIATTEPQSTFMLTSYVFLCPTIRTLHIDFAFIISEMPSPETFATFRAKKLSLWHIDLQGGWWAGQHP